MLAGQETLEAQFGVPGDHSAHLGEAALRQAAAGLEGQRLGAIAKLEDEVGRVAAEGAQEALVDGGGVEAAFGLTGLGPAPQGGVQAAVRSRLEIEIGRDVRRGGDDTVGRDGLDVVLDRGIQVGPGADDALGLGPSARADRGRALRGPSPTAFQLVQGGVVLAPLAAGKEGPLEGVGEQIILLALATAGPLGAGAPDAGASEHLALPAAVIGPFSDEVIQAQPVGFRQLLGPAVEVPQERPDAPGNVGIADMPEVGQRFADAAVRFGAVRPAGELGQPCPRWTARRIEFADRHVVEQDVVQPACSQTAADQVRVRIDQVQSREHGQDSVRAHGLRPSAPADRTGAARNTSKGGIPTAPPT